MSSDNSDIPYTVSNPLWVDGIPYPSDFTEEIIRKLPDTPVYDDDIYIAGYLKSGNHWLMATAEAIVRNEDLKSFINKGSLYTVLPIEHPEGYEAHLTANRPRIITTMMRYNSLPRGIREGRGKVIHISRNPRDIAVSYFHFTQMYTTGYGKYTGSWDSFFESFMAGHVSRGKWYDYMIEWMKYREAPNVMIVKYEDYHKNPKGTVKDIAAFLGKTLTEEILNNIAHIVSFKSMQTNQNLSVKHGLFEGEFMRKGVVGDWVDYFTPEQDKVMDKMYKQFKAETGIEFSFK